MRLLLDTHALLWFLNNDPRLGALARSRIADPNNEVWVSIVSLLEITIKLRIGKLRADLGSIMTALPPLRIRLLELRPEHLIEMARLPAFPDHRDPFDHMLIAQAIAESLTFVTEDRNADRYQLQLLRCSAAISQ